MTGRRRKGAHPLRSLAERFAAAAVKADRGRKRLPRESWTHGSRTGELAAYRNAAAMLTSYLDGLGVP